MTGMDASPTPRRQTARLQQFSSGVLLWGAPLGFSSGVLLWGACGADLALLASGEGKHILCHRLCSTGNLSKQICIGMFAFHAYLPFWYIRSCLC